MRMTCLLLVLCVVAATGCTPQKVLVMESSTQGNLQSVSSSGALIFKANDSWASSLQPNDVVVSGISTVTPYGLLRKVTSVLNTNNQVTVNTVVAGLNEAVEKGQLNASRTLTPADLQTAKTKGLGIRAGAKDGEGFFVGFDNYVVYESGENKIMVSGNVSLMPSFEFIVDIENHLVKSIVFEQQSNLLATLDLSANFNYSLTAFEENVATFVFAPIEFMIGNVPVVLVPQLQLFLRVDGAVTASLHASAVFQKTVTLTAEYSGGAWTADGTLSGADFDYSPPTVRNTNATVTTEAGADFSLLLYGIAGPYGKTSAGMDFSSTYAAPEVHWTLTGNLDGYFGFDVETLSLDVAEYPLTHLLNYEHSIAEGNTTITDEGEDEGETGAWSRTLEGLQDDNALAVIQTADKGYLMGGETNSFGGNNSEAWLVKFNSTGTVDWQFRFGGSQTERIVDVLETTDGFLALGETESFGAGETDLWLIKFNANGSIAWQHTYGGVSIESAAAITAVTDGYILAGATYSYDEGPIDDDADILVIKVDTVGSLHWAKAYSGLGSHANSRDIVTAANGDLVLTGAIADTTGGWLLRLDVNGTAKWCYTFDVDFFSAIQESDGSLFTVGRYTPWYSMTTINACITKFNADGAVTWTRVYSQGEEDTEAQGLAVMEDGGCIVAVNMTNPTQTVWGFRLNSEGQVVWAKDYFVGRSATQVNTVATATDHNGLEGCVFAGNTVTPATHENAWLMKLPSDGTITFNTTSEAHSASLTGSINDISLERTTITPQIKTITANLIFRDTTVTPVATTAQIRQQAP